MSAGTAVALPAKSFFHPSQVAAVSPSKCRGGRIRGVWGVLSNQETMGDVRQERALNKTG